LGNIEARTLADGASKPVLRNLPVSPDISISPAGGASLAVLAENRGNLLLPQGKRITIKVGPIYLNRPFWVVDQINQIGPEQSFQAAFDF
jgi:hypothetical protein